MADNLTTVAVITPAVNTYFNRLLLVRNKPKLIHGLFADRSSIPAGKGKNVTWRRYNQLATATATIVEGVTPPGKRLSKQDISAELSQYGDFVHITDVLEFTCENKILNVAVSELNDQMLRTEDELIRNVIVSSASVTTCSKGDVAATDFNETDINTITNTLQNGDAEEVTPLIKASTGQGTSPVLASYWMLAHTALNSDWKNVSGYLSIGEYPSQRGVLEAERCSINEVRILASSVAHKEGSATAAFPSSAGTYYYCPIIAKHAYGVVDLKKANAKLILHPRGTGGPSDPLNQRQTAGWKNMNVCRILNDYNIQVLRGTKMA